MEFKTCEERVLWELSQAEDKVVMKDADINMHKAEISELQTALGNTNNKLQQVEKQFQDFKYQLKDLLGDKVALEEYTSGLYSISIAFTSWSDDKEKFEEAKEFFKDFLQK